YDSWDAGTYSPYSTVDERLRWRFNEIRKERFLSSWYLGSNRDDIDVLPVRRCESSVSAGDHASGFLLRIRLDYLRVADRFPCDIDRSTSVQAHHGGGARRKVWLHCNARSALPERANSVRP